MPARSCSSVSRSAAVRRSIGPTSATKVGCSGLKASFMNGARYAVGDLLNNAASEPCAAATQGSRVICVVVASGVNHQGATRYFGHLEPGRQYRIICIPRGVDVQPRQITKMSVAPRQSVALGCRRIVVATRRQCGHHLPVFFLGLATGVLVHVETMQPRR